jgi:Predicted membrane protein
MEDEVKIKKDMQVRCVVCGRAFPAAGMRKVGQLRPPLLAMVAEEVAGLDDESMICDADLSRYRRLYVEKLLNDERGELSELDRKVLDSFEKGVSTVQSSADAVLERDRTVGERAADAVASFGGSWSFIFSFCVVLVLWMTVNISGMLADPFDPYPFILLNLALSCVAALQAPIIMMSQKRQEAKDRQRAESDYMVNLRAELEIRQLHEKIDHQMARQWERLAELQQIQIELLERNGGWKPERD